MTVAAGLLLFSDYSTSELVELGILAEQLGYRDFWYTDVRFARDCYLGLAAVAARTSKIRLGTGVTDPYARHPAITTASIATLDEMSGGRAVLGLGTGASGMKELGLERKLPVAALRETVEMVRVLLHGQKIDVQGKVISLSGGALTFKPPRADLPIYFATHGAQVTRLAGQVADGVLIANVLVPEAFAVYVGLLQQGMAKVGRDPATFDIGLRVEASISEDDETAFNVMRKRVAGRLVSQYPHWDYLDELGVVMSAEFTAIAAERGPEAADRAAALLPREAVEAMVLAGNPERVAQQLARALSPRVNHIVLRPHALKGQSVIDVVRAFAERVLPRALALRSGAA